MIINVDIAVARKNRRHMYGITYMGATAAAMTKKKHPTERINTPMLKGTVYKGDLRIMTPEDVEKYKKVKKVTGDLDIRITVKLKALKTVWGALNVHEGKLKAVELVYIGTRLAIDDNAALVAPKLRDVGQETL